MKKVVRTTDLQVGMYVELQGNWLTHPFARGSFEITNSNDIDKIQAYYNEAVVDLDKGSWKPCSSTAKQSTEETANAEAVDPTPSADSPDDWQTKNKASDALESVLKKEAPAEEKAAAVFSHSVDLMDNLLSNDPTTELIEESTKPLQSLAECVIHEDDVANTLLRITSHDYYTYTHCVNVGIKALLIARHILGVSDENLLKELTIGFFLHDIGKSKVDPGILNKPGKLSDEEFEIMRSHPERGVQILRDAESLTESSRLITLQHHEKIDGSGYPYHLKGGQVHEFSQLCALADIYDALTAERSYKKGMTTFEALTIMKDQMNQHFEERLIKGMLGLFINGATHQIH